MGDPGIEHDVDAALVALAALVDRLVIVARPLDVVIATSSHDVLSAALAEARIVASSRAAAARGATVGTSLGAAVPAPELRRSLGDPSGPSIRLVHEDGRVSLAIYVEDAQATEAGENALHREIRRWAHDLANTFMTITGHAQLLRRHVAADDESGQRSIDRILEAVERASTKIKDRVRSSSDGSG